MSQLEPVSAPNSAPNASFNLDSPWVILGLTGLGLAMGLALARIMAGQSAQIALAASGILAQAMIIILNPLLGLLVLVTTAPFVLYTGFIVDFSYSAGTKWPNLTPTRIGWILLVVILLAGVAIRRRPMWQPSRLRPQRGTQRVQARRRSKHQRPLPGRQCARQKLRQRLGQEPLIFYDTRNFEAHDQVDILLEQARRSAVSCSPPRERSHFNCDPSRSASTAIKIKSCCPAKCFAAVSATWSAVEKWMKPSRVSSAAP